MIYLGQLENQDWNLYTQLMLHRIFKGKIKIKICIHRDYNTTVTTVIYIYTQIHSST